MLIGSFHSMSEDETSLTSEEVLKLLGSMQTAVEATTSSATPLLTKYVLYYYYAYIYPLTCQNPER